jgi:hypothetical protein
MSDPTTRRPPLPLAAATVAAAWGAVYTVERWISAYVTLPIHDDVRYDYVAAEAGLRYGWSRIYDLSLLARLSAGFPAPQNTIHPGGTFINPPPLAWMWAPLTALSEPAAYLVWTLVGLAALAWTWWIAAPFRGVGKIAMLLAALALWPVLEAFYFGQPTMLVLALVATSWWLIHREKPIAAGVALALAVALKPQVVVMVPICLVVASRWRVVVATAIAGAVIAGLSALTLGPSGLRDFWATLQWIQTDAGHSFFTVAYLFGLGTLTYGVLAVQGALCLVVAWRRRRNLDAVFAIGLLGSLMVSFHLHQPDYCNLVLAAWLVLRGAPSFVTDAWLAVGFVTMQVLTMGIPWPQLVWDLGWLAILGFVDAEDAQKEAREDGLHAEREQHRRRDDLAHGQARI